MGSLQYLQGRELCKDASVNLEVYPREKLGIVAELGMTEASIPYPQRLAARALANGAAVTTPRGETPRVR